MIGMTVAKVAEHTGGTLCGGGGERPVTGAVRDNREVAPGLMFCALPGARRDGHEFIAAALDAGAPCCLAQRVPEGVSGPVVIVPDVAQAMARLAAACRAQVKAPVVGIVGSSGKTTTKEMVACVLARRYDTLRTEKNFNNELGVPWTLLKLDDAHEVSVVEMGISDFGEMSRLTRMVRPNIAVLSAIADSHLEFLGDREGVLRAKAEIFETMGKDDLAVLNGDDALLGRFHPPTRRLTYGMEPGNDFIAENIENLGIRGARCTIRHGASAFEATIPAYGVHMIYAALAAAVVGSALGMRDAEIAEGISRFRNVGERAHVIETGRLTIVSDCYNANPTSTAAAIDSLAALPGRKVCVLGDMLELGENTAALHEGVGEHAAKRGIDLILTTGELSHSTCEGAKRAGGHAVWFPDKAALVAALPDWIRPGDCVLVKASHSMAFEEITEALKTL